jgi:hypothetical protein
LPLLVVVSKHLNPWCVEGPPPFTPINDDPLRGVATSIKEIYNLFLVNELFLYRRIHVDDNNVKSPLQWWKYHAKQFLNVTFLAHQFLGISRSQIKIECIFKHCWNID